jgi:hypothetical protein
MVCALLWYSEKKRIVNITAIAEGLISSNMATGEK